MRGLSSAGVAKTCWSRTRQADVWDLHGVEPSKLWELIHHLGAKWKLLFLFFFL